MRVAMMSASFRDVATKIVARFFTASTAPSPRFRNRRQEVSARHRSGWLVVAVAEYRNRDGASAPAAEFETSAWGDVASDTA
jgi:hypothetical protein